MQFVRLGALPLTSRSSHMLLTSGLLRFCIGSFESYSLVIYEVLILHLILS